MTLHGRNDDPIVDVNRELEKATWDSDIESDFDEVAQNDEVLPITRLINITRRQ